MSQATLVLQDLFAGGSHFKRWAASEVCACMGCSEAIHSLICPMLRQQ